MGMCLNGTRDDVAEVVVLTSDPDRVRWIAGNLLTEVTFFNELRNMPGCTGLYRGKRVSVQGESVGPVNAAIYAVEIAELGPKTLIKIDGCAALQEGIEPGSLILAQTAHTTSTINRSRFAGSVFPAVADFLLLNDLYDKALKAGNRVYAGPVVSIEHRGELDIAMKFASRGALAMDNEMNQTFTAAQRFHIRSAGVLSVFENAVTGKSLSPQERDREFAKLAEFTLNAVLL